MKPKIFFEDNHLLVVEKPQNMPVQGDTSGDSDLLSLLKQYIKQKYNKPGNVFLGLVHRLDRPVGGVMVFARTSKAASRLAVAFQRRRVEKTYLCVVEGIMTQHGTLKNFLRKDRATNTVTVVSPTAPDAKEARLRYETLEAQNGMSLVRVHLETGRSHQIRVQFADAGHPIVNDAKYGTKPNVHGKFTIALWASRLSFEHPTTHERLTFTAELPHEEPWNFFHSYKKTS